MRRLACLLGAALGAAAVPAGAQQPSRCLLELENTPTTRFTYDRVQGNSFAGGGVIAHCSGQQITLSADSAEYYSGRSTLYLIGRVRYVEPRVRVNSQRMTYFQAEERLYADGNVDAVLPTGTTMSGPNADYYREIPGLRARSRLNATGRPRFRIVQPDTTGRPTEPTALVADRVTTDGDNLVYATGRVEIDRTDVSARGDSAYLDSAREFARLMRAPYIEGKGDRPFTLRGTVIDLHSRQRQLERVVAVSQAQALSQDLRLTSDTIDMRIVGGQLERAYAWGKSRARVTSPDRDIVADSLDVQLPRQRLTEVRALRGAYAETVADTTRFRTTERDWLRGDTIIARFDTATRAAAARAPRDTSTRPRIRQLEASGNAKSFYQLVAEGGTRTSRPAVNYVVGRVITVAFANQAVQTVTVLDRATGVYLEPVDSAAARRATPASGGTNRARPGPAAAPPSRPTRPPTRPGTRTPTGGRS